MASSFTYFGNNTSYQPRLHDLTIAYVRNPANFAVNKFLSIKKTDQQIGLYWNYANDSQNRFVDADYSLWPDGQNVPDLTYEPNDPFDFLQFACQRYVYTRKYGMLGVQQADFQDVLGMGSQFLANQAAVNRSARIYSTLTTSASWPSANVATATALGGGLWGNATSVAPYIKKSINTAMTNIQKQTNAAIALSDFYLIVNPDTATLISSTQELIDQLKQSPITYDVWTGSANFSQFNLPDHLYGLNVVVDATVMNTSLPGQADSFSYCMPDNFAVIVTKQNAVNSGGGPSFGTCVLWTFQDMETFLVTDVENQIYKLRVSENSDTSKNLLVAPASGQLITNLFS